MKKLLDGVKVVDWTQAHHGSATGYMLGDLGADVIKVEDPDGDIGRTWRSILGVSLELPGDRNILFEGANRNKRSITLNLRSDRGKELFRELVADADVLLTNHRRPARERLGLDYSSLAGQYPRLIYALATAYGEAGPFADERSFDNVAVAWSGMMHCIGEEGSPPQYMTPGACDQLGATMLAQGVLGALYYRERTGEGQQVEASLLGAMSNMLAMPFNLFLMTGRLPKRPVRTEVFNPLIGWYRCADDRWIMFSLNRPQETWPDFCQVVGLEDSVKINPKFDSTRHRADNCAELIGIIDAAIAKKPREEWLAACRDRGLICAPVNRIEDISSDEQMTANNYVVDMDHETIGPIKTVGAPVTYSKAQAEVRMGAPELGQHTEEILLEQGYTWEQIEELRTTGII